MMERIYTIQDLKSLIRLCREFFQDTEGVIAAYLHGSIPRKGQGHDLDIAIFPDRKLDEFRVGSQLERWLAQKGIKIPVDLRNLSHAPIWAQFQVIKEGLRIYHRNLKEAQDMEFWIISHYLDFKPLMDSYDREMKRKILAI